jgi:hypothetical protein
MRAYCASDTKMLASSNMPFIVVPVARIHTLDATEVRCQLSATLGSWAKLVAVPLEVQSVPFLMSQCDEMRYSSKALDGNG